MDAATLRNVRQLYKILSIVPKERVKKACTPYVDFNKRKSTKWNYTFSAENLKSASLLYGFCNRNGLRFSVTMRGILVYGISNKQINEARKKCNKCSCKYAITL